MNSPNQSQSTIEVSSQTTSSNKPDTDKQFAALLYHKYFKQELEIPVHARHLKNARNNSQHNALALAVEEYFTELSSRPGKLENSFHIVELQVTVHCTTILIRIHGYQYNIGAVYNHDSNTIFRLKDTFKATAQGIVGRQFTARMSYQYKE